MTSTYPNAVKKYKLEKLRLGDVVCLVNQIYVNGSGYHKEVVTIGVVIHGASNISGHGLGDKPSLTSRKVGLRTASNQLQHRNIPGVKGYAMEPI